MKEEMRYITYEEQLLYEKLAKEYNIKGFSSGAYLTFQKNNLKSVAVKKNQKSKK